MITVQTVIDAMDAWAHPGLAYSWDKAGLATGHPHQKVTKVATALTITSEVLRDAKRKKADMIVSHHPVIWEPLTTLRLDQGLSKLYTEIVKAGIACYSAHTNLDVAPGGVNHILAKRLGLQNLRPLFPAPQAQQFKLVTFVPESHLAAVREAVSEAGAGTIGDYTHCSFSTPGTGTFKPNDQATPYSGKRKIVNEEPEARFETLVPKTHVPQVLAALMKAHPYEEVAYDLVQLDNIDPVMSLGLRGTLSRPVSLANYAGKVRDALEIKHVRYSGDPKAKISEVAVMGGAGGESWSRIPSGVDVYVTGDVKYHDALDSRETGLNVIDAGHHGTEKWIVPAMADYLKKNVAGLKVASCVEADPFRAVTK